MNDTSNVVVLFPHHDGTEPTSLEEVAVRMDYIREVFVESAAEAVTNEVIAASIAAGFPINEYDQSREIGLVMACIKSLMMASRGIHHPLQDTAEEMFELVVEDDYAEEASE